MFEEVLLTHPDHSEAHYGVGYTQLKRNNLSEATVHLCAAQGSMNPDTERDVRSLLERNNLSCD